MTPGALPRSRFALGLLAVSVLGAALRAWGLPGQVIFGDDACVALSAVSYVERGVIGPTMWHHPHLRDLLVYLSMSAFGEGKLALTLVSLSLGVLSVPLLGFVALRLTGSRAAALLAALLLAIDPVHAGYSRQAVHEDYGLFFILLGVLGALGWARGGRALALLGAGAAFGLGLASKWYAAFPLAVLWGWLMVSAWRTQARAARAAKVLFVCATLLFLPALVYLLTYVPWFLGGRGFAEWIDLQRAMLHEASVHAGNDRFAPTFAAPAWQWFVRPVWHVDAGFGSGDPVILVAITNPTVWLLILPAVAWAGVRARRETDAGMKLTVLLFAASWLPFLFMSRLLWVHTAFAALPFGLVAVAWSALDLASRLRRGRAALGAWLAAVGLLAAPLLVLAIGEGRSLALLRPVVEAFRPYHEVGEP